MTASGRHRVVFATVMLVAVGARVVAHANHRGTHADLPATPRILSSHIRSPDPRCAWLVSTGIEYSPVFRHVVTDIEHSDVIAYVQRDQSLTGHVAGEVAFMTAAGEFRYVRIRLRPLDDAAAAVAILGHELAHVREVARHPEIVDDASMTDAYLTFGSVRLQGTRLVADTTNAGIIADEVRHDLQTRHAELDLDLEQVERRYAAAHRGVAASDPGPSF